MIFCTAVMPGVIPGGPQDREGDPLTYVAAWIPFASLRPGMTLWCPRPRHGEALRLPGI